MWEQIQFSIEWIDKICIQATNRFTRQFCSIIHVINIAFGFLHGWTFESALIDTTAKIVVSPHTHNKLDTQKSICRYVFNLLSKLQFLGLISTYFLYSLRHKGEHKKILSFEIESQNKVNLAK